MVYIVFLWHIHTVQWVSELSMRILGFCRGLIVPSSSSVHCHFFDGIFMVGGAMAVQWQIAPTAHQGQPQPFATLVWV